jgi:transcriptional regulator
MYISKEQLASRLQGQSNLELKKREGIGKRKELPHETKVLAGVLARFDTQKNVAEALGTSQANISNIANNPELQKEIKAKDEIVRDTVSGKAIDILIKSLNIVEDKVAKEDAKDASAIARNMASIFDKVRNRAASENPNSAPKILINIHGSKQKAEDDYEVVDVESVSA